MVVVEKNQQNQQILRCGKFRCLISQKSELPSPFTLHKRIFKILILTKY